jgi:serine phosphatase RsbU (regulator of sigma subunit)/anti-sigma regulatory factor (Ser/Thr protein kinase)
VANLIVDLASSRASIRTRAWAISLTTAIVLITIPIALLASEQGPSVPAFLPAVYAAALLAYALTSFLFANQYATTSSPGFGILSVAYAFAFAITVPYLLSYPGVFSDQGLIGQGGNTSAWLYLIEHYGFLALVLGYAFTEFRAERRERSPEPSKAYVFSVAIATLVLTFIGVGAALFDADSIPLVAGSRATGAFTYVLAPIALVLDLAVTIALLVVVRRGSKTTPLWMAVVTTAIGFELFTSAIGGGRYTVGWYFSRVEVVVAAGLILCVFLYYINIALKLQANSMRLLASARDAAELASAEKEALLREYVREQRVARTFQSAALPTSLPSVPGVVFDGFYAPGKSEALIGGDWFDALRLPDGRIVISIGDVAGSGLDAAVIMANMRQVIRGIAHVHSDPAMILEAADRVLRAEHPERFVTAFVALYEPMYHTLTFASAGHNRPFKREPSGAIAELASEGLPLGLRVRGESNHSVTAVVPGTFLVFYTDGLVESTHDYEDGERRLRSALANRAILDDAHPARRIHDVVLENGSRDDVAILTMRIDHAIENESSRWTFHSSDGASARAVRDEIEALLAAHGAGRSDCVAAATVFSELVGNVVRYAPGRVEVLLDRSNPVPVLHMLDEGPGFSRFPELPRNLFSETGRGLFIVATLAEDFAVTRREQRGSHARVVLSLRRARGRLGARQTIAWSPDGDRSASPALIDRVVDR